MRLQIAAQASPTDTIIYIGGTQTDWASLGFNELDTTHIQEQIKAKNVIIGFRRADRWEAAAYFELDKDKYKTLENCRNAGAAAATQLNKVRVKSVFIANESDLPEAALLFAEGMVLASYQFLKYKKEKDAAPIRSTLEQIGIHHDAATETEVAEIQHLTDAVYTARDLINEPVMYMTAVQLSEEAQKLGKKAGFKTTVFDKKKLQKMGMGGILSVNLGSQDPPTFTVMEYKPKKAVNQQPIVLVGKGVVYDTGGLSLKPTPNAMDHMKCDMAGGAAVMCALYAAAMNQLPIHVIGLVPATDNRPGENAYTPGDVIKMYDGSHVEVLNTDAEGRMLLGDALAYAKQYQPELVIDIATLTGAAAMAMGNQGALLMGNASEEIKNQVKKCSYEVYERLNEMPLWDEYFEQIKSDIADIKNTGGPGAGSITAGKFLEYFTDYPWLHIDMAPTGWNQTTTGYRIKNGSGFGVRLLYAVLKARSQQGQ